MKNKNVDREKFTFKNRNHNFECAVSLRAYPPVLLVAAVGTAFVLTIRTLEDTNGRLYAQLNWQEYSRLCKTIGATYKEGGFTSFEFLRTLDMACPRKCGLHSAKQDGINELVLSGADDNAKKLYRCINFHSEESGRHVTSKNLKKTREILGDDVADFCKSANASISYMKDSE